MAAMRQVGPVSQVGLVGKEGLWKNAASLSHLPYTPDPPQF